MKFKLDKKFTIEQNSNGFELHYRVKTGKISESTGKEIIDHDIWYYPTFKMSYGKYLDKCLLGDKEVNENKILNKYKEIEEMIKNIKEVKIK